LDNRGCQRRDLVSFAIRSPFPTKRKRGAIGRIENWQKAEKAKCSWRSKFADCASPLFTG
jgi:hypothetical protein